MPRNATLLRSNLAKYGYAKRKTEVSIRPNGGVKQECPAPKYYSIAARDGSHQPAKIAQQAGRAPDVLHC